MSTETNTMGTTSSPSSLMSTAPNCLTIALKAAKKDSGQDAKDAVLVFFFGWFVVLKLFSADSSQ